MSAGKLIGQLIEPAMGIVDLPVEQPDNRSDSVWMALSTRWVARFNRAMIGASDTEGECFDEEVA